MRIRQTHTYVEMAVSEEVYDEIRKKLIEADYTHAIHDDEGGALDMHGIALVKAAAPPKPTAHASTSPGPSNCNIRKHYQGEIYPSKCGRCHPGPCIFFNGDGTAKL